LLTGDDFFKPRNERSCLGWRVRAFMEVRLQSEDPLNLQYSSMIYTPGREMEHWEFEALDMDISTICTVYCPWV
jgi:hypothetical protein